MTIEAINKDADFIIRHTPDEKAFRKIVKVFRDCVMSLPEPDFDVTKPQFVKQKVMRKFDRKWSAAAIRLCRKSYGRQREIVNGEYFGHAVVKAVDRMVWSSNWLFNEINRQLDEQDPELDELWEEQKREEGIE